MKKMTSGHSHGALSREKNPVLDKLTATGLFLQELVRFPREVGAILPSSKKLSNAMARWIPMLPDEHVLELGPGTGVVTEALLKHGLAEDKLIAIEQSDRMAELLRKRFPRATIITGDAFKLDTLLRKHAPKVRVVGAVVSSLPLLNFEPDIAEDLARKIYSVLPDHGLLVQYSYKLTGKQPKAAKHFQLKASDRIWLNVPPARVCVYEK